MIFSDVCYENPLIGETKDKVENLQGRDVKTEIINGYVNTEGSIVSGGSTYRYTSFIPVKEHDELEFGISGSSSTLGYSEYADNTESSIIVESSIKNDNTYKRMSKKIGRTFR